MTMQYHIRLTVTHEWRVHVEADGRVEALAKAPLIYEESINPWDDERLEDIPSGTVIRAREE